MMKLMDLFLFFAASRRVLPVWVGETGHLLKAQAHNKLFGVAMGPALITRYS